MPAAGSLPPGDPLAIAAVALASSDPGGTDLVVLAREPRAAVAVAAQRPRVPVMAVVPDERSARLLVGVRGVWPVVAAAFASPGTLTAADLLRDASVRSALRGTGRAVVVAASADGTLERIEALAIPALGG
jgi:pyruvate kinase